MIRARVLGCEIDALDLDATADLCAEVVTHGLRATHVSVNAAKLVSMRDDPRMREIITNSEIVSADGQAIVWAAKLLGSRLPGRVAGIDLMEKLLALAADAHWRVYLLGAEQRVLDLAIERIRERYPSLEVCGSHHGYFSHADEPTILRSIEKARPDLVFVAMSSPRKEYWIARHRERLAVPLVMGVGGALDVLAGKTRRAPMFMRRVGLEWLFRLAQEPRRLFARYLLTNLRFLGLLGRALISKSAAAEMSDL
jgi:N-acetylglucosaminyldiphosphoundecaprenol N-acetyl-beta-D-mannosaminyltransferase